MDRSGSHWSYLSTPSLTRTLPVPAVLLLGALLSRWILHFVPSRFAADFAQPIVVATWWGAYGALLWAVLAGTLAVACVFYLRVFDRDPPLRETFFACGLALAASLAWLPLFSSDVYAYAAYGEMARLGMDPYVHLTTHAADPILAAAQWQWNGAFPACVYGPAFVTLAAGVTALTGATHVVFTLQILRVVSCVAFLICVFLISRISTRAAWFLALNPIALWSAAEGHNDTVALAVVLAGFVLVRRSSFAGSAIVASAALVKLPALAASFGYLCNALFTRTRAGSVAAGTLAGTALAGAGLFLLGTTVRANSFAHGVYQPLASVQSLHPIAAVALVVAVLARIRAFEESLDRWCVLSLALWAAIPNPYPWYALWILALAALCSDARVRLTAVAIGVAAVVRYVPDAAAIPAEPWSLLFGTVALAAYAPLWLPKRQRALSR